MRSVVRLRTRPGRPIWQLTTRPSTSAVLALVSLAAAGVQLALSSSPAPWYQVAVVAFWAVVGVAFVVSAVGTRSRARRQDAAAAARPPADPMPFVPVPVRPARPRRRETVAGEAPVAAEDVSKDVAEVGEPTDPVETPRTTTLRSTPRPAPATERTAVADRPRPSLRPSPRPGRRPVVAEKRERIASAPRPAPSWRPSREPEEVTATVAVTSRHAVRAVALAESASREFAVPGVTGTGRRTTSPRALTAETIAIRDGRVRPRPSATGPADRAGTDRAAADRAAADVSDRPSPTARSTGGGRRRLVDGSRAAPAPSRGGAAPTAAVPSPRPAPREERPAPHEKRPERPVGAERATSAPRPAPPREAEGSGTARPSVHARRSAAADRAAAASAPGTTRRREGPPASTETTAPFGGGMTFGGRAIPAEPAPESWAPAPRRPVPEPATGRHAALTAAPLDGVPRGAAARHAVAAEPRRPGAVSR